MTLMSITETPNDLTQEIDIADARGILDLLSQTDAQIFHGWESWKGLSDPDFLANLGRAVNILKTTLLEARDAGEEARILFTGAGTSGRLAMLLAEEFNAAFAAVLGYEPLDFLIAGGHGALIKAKEGAEDDPVSGVSELEKRVPESGRFVTIGITCGFSANYIAGQIHDTVIGWRRPAFLIGFNPLERARTVKPENWDKSFADVVREVQDHEHMVFLNPVVGPEPVTGSTRMKGGSATKIIGECLLYLAWLGLQKETGDARGIAEAKDRARTLIRQYEEAALRVYEKKERLAPVLERAGSTLNQGGRIVYLGEGIAGKLGIIDASECPPTFGAGFGDVRGFLPGGWADFCPVCTDLSSADPLYDIGFPYFEKAILPSMSSRDTLIVTGTESFFRTHAALLNRCRSIQPVRILISDAAEIREPMAGDADLVLETRDFGAIPMLSGFQLKLIYNAVTTAAHIFKGKVYRNKMIDLRISNNKLYHRSIHIVREIAGVPASDAETALLKAIYASDQISGAQLDAPVSRHVETATDREKIVPVALVLAASDLGYEQAVEKVNRDHVVRNIISNL